MPITKGIHLYPFRTEKLSPCVPMVLQLKPLRADGTAAMWESRSVPDLESPAGSKPRGFFCLSRGGQSQTFVVLFESFSFRVL